MTKQTVLITGGTGVVGRALISAMDMAGYRVVTTSRQGSSVDGAETISADLLEEGGVAALIDSLKKAGIAVDHLINNFRDSGNLKTDSGRPSQEQWQREYMSSVIVPFDLAMRLTDLGGLKSVINITSIYGITAGNLSLYNGNQAAAPIHYNVSKAAEAHLTREMAVRLVDKNIRVNAIAYGGIKGRADADFEKRYAALCPQQGMLESSDLPGAALFLLSDQAAGRVTGQVLQVDGGWTIW
ncbi:MAG TPA: SDR family oxidoreductase [Micavibrio sp.]|nr:SDR family oxidoreductase [Micavibrio sp.]